MKQLLKLTAIALSIIFITFSCKEETEPINNPTPDPLESYTVIGEQEVGNSGFTAKLYMLESPFVGYNYVVARLVETGTSNLVTNADVTFKPMMNMTSMSHSCPVEQPMYDADLNGYSGTTTFVMPTSQMGSWEYTLEVVAAGGMDVHTATFDITVMEKSEKKLYSFVSNTDNSKVFVALIEPKDPKVGMNSFEVVIYKKESMMMWPAYNGLMIEIDPQMPSMGHGSPNNVDPTFLDNGHYQGMVNFTMSGYWEINLDIKDAAGTVMNDDGFFEMTI